MRIDTSHPLSTHVSVTLDGEDIGLYTILADEERGYALCYDAEPRLCEVPDHVRVMVRRGAVKVTFSDDPDIPAELKAISSPSDSAYPDDLIKSLGPEACIECARRVGAKEPPLPDWAAHIKSWNCRADQAGMAAMRDGHRDGGGSDETLKAALLKEGCPGCVAKVLGEEFWECPDCDHPQPGPRPSYPSEHPCKGCGKPMCEGCRGDNSYCGECRSEGRG